MNEEDSHRWELATNRVTVITDAFFKVDDGLNTLEGMLSDVHRLPEPDQLDVAYILAHTLPPGPRPLEGGQLIRGDVDALASKWEIVRGRLMALMDLHRE